jgi:hypothetical protein
LREAGGHVQTQRNHSVDQDEDDQVKEIIHASDFDFLEAATAEAEGFPDEEGDEY